jgi:TPR repeat protein
VSQNYTTAKVLFEKAIEKDLPAAYNGLGVLHFNGCASSECSLNGH